MLNNVMYIAKGYINTENAKELEDIVFVRDDMNDELLSKIWQNYNFEKAEEQVFNLQCKLTKATIAHNDKNMFLYQTKIVHSTEARMLSVRKVAEITKAKARN